MTSLYPSPVALIIGDQIASGYYEAAVRLGLHKPVTELPNEYLATHSDIVSVDNFCDAITRHRSLLRGVKYVIISIGNHEGFAFDDAGVDISYKSKDKLKKVREYINNLQVAPIPGKKTPGPNVIWLMPLHNGGLSGGPGTGGNQISGFLKSTANLSNANFITKCYQIILGREPETEGYDYWMSMITASWQGTWQPSKRFSNGARATIPRRPQTRSQIASQFYASKEFKTSSIPRAVYKDIVNIAKTYKDTVWDLAKVISAGNLYDYENQKYYYACGTPLLPRSKNPWMPTDRGYEQLAKHVHKHCGGFALPPSYSFDASSPTGNQLLINGPTSNDERAAAMVREAEEAARINGLSAPTFDTSLPLKQDFC